MADASYSSSSSKKRNDPAPPTPQTLRLKLRRSSPDTRTGEDEQERGTALVPSKSPVVGPTKPTLHDKLKGKYALCHRSSNDGSSRITKLIPVEHFTLAELEFIFHNPHVCNEDSFEDGTPTGKEKQDAFESAAIKIYQYRDVCDPEFFDNSRLADCSVGLFFEEMLVM